MINDRENNQHHQPGMGSADNLGRDRTEQFNELSELSLEERIAVANQIGIPVDNAGEAAATGTMSGGNDAAAGDNERMEDESTRTETDR